MASIIKLKYSDIAGNIPALSNGEVAINRIDKKLFYTDNTGTVKFFNLDLKPRVQTVTSASIVTPDADNNDSVKITAQAVALILANPSGSPFPMQSMVIRIKDNGTARTISFGTQYRAIGITLPITTIASKLLYLGIVYNSDDYKWDVTGVSQEA